MMESDDGMKLDMCDDDYMIQFHAFTHSRRETAACTINKSIFSCCNKSSNTVLLAYKRVPGCEILKLLLTTSKLSPKVFNSRKVALQ